MAVLLDTPVAAGPAGSQAEAAARSDLRAQIARLEASGGRAPGKRGPALLTLGELEAIRDAMTTRTSLLPRHDMASGTFAARARLEAMFADPRSHKFAKVTRADAGLPGCGAYRCRPRLGLIGMLAGWWHITLSSGCP